MYESAARLFLDYYDMISHIPHTPNGRVITLYRHMANVEQVKDLLWSSQVYGGVMIELSFMTPLSH